uniref:Lipocalin-2 1 n=1 Tax=Amblyomma tuberculatum TaxID=48802 RepID=A0A6M2E6I6_9ACAR
MKLILEHKLSIFLFVFHLCKGNQLNQELTNFDGQLDILQVLNTSEKLWLYKESYRNWRLSHHQQNGISLTYSCLNFHKIYLSASQYNFTEQFSYGEEWQSVNCTAKIVLNDTLPHHPPKSMEIFDSRGQERELMTLQYTDSGSYQCSVFYVSSLSKAVSNDALTCEMYIRDSAVDKYPSAGCESFFTNHCAGTEFKIYSEKCKNRTLETNSL